MNTKPLETEFTRHAGIQYPIICGAMYPCSNPELVAAASEAGGIGIIQPISMTFVHRHEYHEGFKMIRRLTSKPIGLNVMVEKSAKIYEDKMRKWVDGALEEGVRFFVTSLGNPRWVVDRVKSLGGIVYHDVINRKWSIKAMDAGVHGLICVNNRAGGHAGTKSPEKLFDELKDLGVPLICAGGVGDEHYFKKMIQMGYSGVQMGTRFIATQECSSHHDYKESIVRAVEKDIVLTERITGVPLSVIRTPYVDRVGLKIGRLGRALFKNHKTKYYIRTFYNLKAMFAMKRTALTGVSTKDYYQAGKSVAGIHSIESVGEIIRKMVSVF